MKLSEIIEALKAKKGVSLDISASSLDGKLCGCLYTSLNHFKELVKGRVHQVEFERKAGADHPYGLRLFDIIEDLGCELEIKVS